MRELERRRSRLGMGELLQAVSMAVLDGPAHRLDAEDAADLLVLALETVLRTHAPALDTWEAIARRLQLPRPPVHLPPAVRPDFLRWWLRTLDLERASQFGVSQELAFTMAKLSTPGAESDPALSSLPAGAIPVLLGGTACACLLYAPGDQKSGWSLCALASRLVEELRRRGVSGRQLRGFDGEALALEAALHALDGDFSNARYFLQRAEQLLGTRSRVQAWSEHGDLVPPSAPHVALRAHGVWMYSRGVVEAVGGHVTAAAAAWQSAYQLFLYAGQYCLAGLAVGAVAQAQLWQGHPGRAVRPLETSLQLLDRRALLLLGQHQEWSLAALYARTGQTEQCRDELRSLRFSVAQGHPWAGRVAGLLDVALLAFDRARLQLGAALRQAQRPPLRLQLALDLAQLEVQAHKPDEARAWMQQVRREVETLPPRLQELWWRAAQEAGNAETGHLEGGHLATVKMAGKLEPGSLEALRAEVQRATDCQRAAWRPRQEGSILEDDSEGESGDG